MCNAPLYMPAVVWVSDASSKLVLDIARTTKGENHTDLKMREGRNEYKTKGHFFLQERPTEEEALKRMNDGDGRVWGNVR